MRQRILSMTEKQFSALIWETATRLKWRAYHPWDSRHSAEGWPDWAFARERLLFAELKVGKGKLTVVQRDWLTVLARTGQEVYLVRPADFEEFATVLQSEVGNVPLVGCRWVSGDDRQIGCRWDEREAEAA